VTNDFCEFLYRYSTGRVPVPSAWLGTGRFKQRGTWGNSLLTTVLLALLLDSV